MKVVEKRRGGERKKRDQRSIWRGRERGGKDRGAAWLASISADSIYPRKKGKRKEKTAAGGTIKKEKKKGKTPRGRQPTTFTHSFSDLTRSGIYRGKEKKVRRSSKGFQERGKGQPPRS